MAEGSENKLARASTKIIDPTGMAPGCFVGWVVFLGLLCLIPFAGVIVAVLSVIWIKGSRHERIEALKHRIDAPPALAAKVSVGDVVTLCGRVVSQEAVKTPLGNHAVLAELWLDDEVAESVQDPVPNWTQQLGGDLLVRTESGAQVAIEGPWSLFSDKTQTTLQYDGVPPVHAPLSDEEREALKEKGSQYGERWLEGDAECLVTGQVKSVTQVEAQGTVGYRGLEIVRRVAMEPPPGGVVRISTFSPAAIAEKAREAEAVIRGGQIAIVMGTLSTYAWWRFIFG